MQATLVEKGNNRLRYLVVNDSESPSSVRLTTTGALAHDLLTDSLAGPVKVCANAFNDGIGQLPAGAMTQAQARAIWLADQADAVLGNRKVARCVCEVTPRTGDITWLVDADVDGLGHPFVLVSSSGPSSAYVDVFTQGAIGL
jgi:hypothetical protein